MGKRILCGFLGLVPGYFLGLFGCLWLLPLFSGHPHDSSVEAAMTGAFVFGPMAALVGFGLGAFLAKPKSAPPPDSGSGAD